MKERFQEIAKLVPAKEIKLEIDKNHLFVLLVELAQL